MKKIKFTSRLMLERVKNIDIGIDTTLYNYRLDAKTDFKCSIQILLEFDTLKENPNEVKIDIFDIMYDTVISKHLIDTKLDRLDSIIYELLGRYFGIYEGSKPDDFMVIEFEDLEHFSIIADNLGFDD